jgi:hypothetical protein
MSFLIARFREMHRTPIAARLFCPFRAIHNGRRLPRAALCGFAAALCPWAGLFEALQAKNRVTG